jgi:cytidine deaminase
MSDGIPWDALFEAATLARGRAYAPYSKFRVGAAALFEDGQIVSGCNVENSSYGLAVCAERGVISRAVVEGLQHPRAFAIVADSAVPVPPCGMCRQVMAEFAGTSLPVRFRNLQGQEKQVTLGELLPHAFTKEML